MVFKKLFILILNTLFPPVCAHCKAEGDFLCLGCLSQLKKQKVGPYSKNLKSFNHLNGVIYALDYGKNPIIQSAIKQFKYKFNQDLADYFSRLIVEKIQELDMAKDKELVLIPVPLHSKRLKERGFNQSYVLAKAIQKLDTKMTILPLLKRVRYTKQQAKLNKKERYYNLKNAFVFQGDVAKYNENKIYFILDDVCTTGSTLEACAISLKIAGFKRVYGLVIGRAFKN